MDRATASILAVGVSSTLTCPTKKSVLLLSLLFLDYKMFKIFLVFILITCIMYLFGSFYYATFDIKYWSPEGKFSLLTLDGLFFHLLYFHKLS